MALTVVAGVTAQYAVAAENTTYEKEILNIAERIIETKDYPQLLKILENYDMLVKEKANGKREETILIGVMVLIQMDKNK